MLPPAESTREEIPMDCSAMTYTNEACNENMYQTSQQNPVETVPQTFAQPQIVYVQQEQPMLYDYQAQDAVPIPQHVQQEHITYGDDGMNEYANYANYADEETQDQEDLVEDIQCFAIQQTAYQQQPRKCWSCGSQYHIQRDCPRHHMVPRNQQRPFARPYQNQQTSYPQPPIRYQQPYRPQTIMYRSQQSYVRPQQQHQQQPQPQQRNQRSFRPIRQNPLYGPTQSFRQQQPQGFRQTPGQLGANKKPHMSHF